MCLYLNFLIYFFYILYIKMENQLQRFKINLNCTSNNETFRINLPLDITDETFMNITSIIGKTTASNLDVFIHSSTFAQEYIYESSTGGNDLVASCVLSSTVSQPFFNNVSDTDLGFKVPSFLNFDPNIQITLTDHTGALIDNSEISFVNIGIDVYNRSAGRTF